MHMADALIAPTVAGAMYICSAGAARYSMKKLSLENDPKKIPLMGIMGAFVFAAQMINFTIPGTGSSGHLCGGMLLSAVYNDVNDEEKLHLVMVDDQIPAGAKLY